MYLIDHVAEVRFVNRLIYAVKRIYTHTHTIISAERSSTGKMNEYSKWFFLCRALPSN